MYVNYEHIRENHTGTNTRVAQAVVETALGKSIPDGAEIHHVDGNPANNENTNLVLCNDRSYHKILHARTKALMVSGNADLKRCWVCKEYDYEYNLTKQGRGYAHRECIRAYSRNRPEKKICWICKKDDNPEDLVKNIANNQYYHKECQRILKKIQRNGFVQVLKEES